MINHRFDEQLLAQLTEAVTITQEVKVSQLQALCLAKDSEILGLESKINELKSKLKEMQSSLSTQPQFKSSVGVQTIEKPISPDQLLSLQSQNFEYLKKIEQLERNLFNSEIKCIELNQMIKSCYNDVELYEDYGSKPPKDAGVRVKHRVTSVIEKDYQRSISQEPEDPRARCSPNKLSLINLINYKSNLAEHSKTPTQKHGINSFNFPSSIRKKLSSPMPRFN